MVKKYLPGNDAGASWRVPSEELDEVAWSPPEEGSCWTDEFVWSIITTMFKKYLAASVIALARGTLGGMGQAFMQIAHLADVAFQQSCEDLNAERSKQVENEPEPKPKLKPEDMN